MIRRQTVKFSVYGAFSSMMLRHHDLLYRDRRDAASIEFSRYLPNVKIIREPITIEEDAFYPRPGETVGEYGK